ncbi:MAG: V-type ATP synthase subunit I [Oscillospiraceae bacterium]|nr:V-type ATP synthase subunit I [Oscillospiraceae bacterium]
MAKIKLVHFELIALLQESKKLMDYLQKIGITEIEQTGCPDIVKYETDGIVRQFERYYEIAESAKNTVEQYCRIKRSFARSLRDYDYIEYRDFRLKFDKADEILSLCRDILKLSDEISAIRTEIIRLNTLIEYLKSWERLDIPMSSTRTGKTSIFIGSFKKELTAEKLKNELAVSLPETEGIEVQIIHATKLLTNVVVLCYIDDGDKVAAALKSLGFTFPDSPVKKLPSAAIKEYQEQIAQLEERKEEIIIQIGEYQSSYGDIRFVCDYFLAQIEKYKTLERAGSTDKTIYMEGYVPDKDSDDLKFELEKRFCCQIEFSEPDYESEDVPVLIENRSFAAGVESITDMYSPVSNRDIDPNPVMSFFYYGLFGMMLSDAGYGLLMVIAALVAKFRFKVEGSKKKTADFILYCGISTVIWGSLFGGFFGDLIPTICTSFLGMEKGPDLALWLSPLDNSVSMLLFSFLIGIIHLFVGLAMRFYTLCKRREYVAAVCDVIPVYVFVTGLAIIGKNFISPVSEKAKSVGMILLAAGAALIILTAGRSAKNILGKLGGGFYALYNTTTGYLGDILSYSRLLALCLVTGVIANMVNMMGAMFGNIILFVIIFILGHALNITINLIGTYVHTSRLQYVEFFSKFYEGGGKVFTPFRFHSKYHKFKEEPINE